MLVDITGWQYPLVSGHYADKIRACFGDHKSVVLLSRKKVFPEISSVKKGPAGRWVGGGGVAGKKNFRRNRELFIFGVLRAGSMALATQGRLSIEIRRLALSEA